MVDEHEGLPPMRGEGQLLQAMVAQQLHQDTFFWNQTRILMIFQGAALSASYLVFPSVLSAAILFLALLLTWYMRRVTTIIRYHRDANVWAIDQVARFIANPELSKSIIDYNKGLEASGYRFKGDGLILFSLEHPSHGDRPGYNYISTFFLAAIACDLILGIFYAVCMVLDIPSFKCLTLHNILSKSLAALRCI